MVDRDEFPSFHRISSHGLVSFDSVSEEFLTFLPEEDYDDDDDSVPDASDACQSGDLGWTSASANDHDSDGCRDESEDDDDDNDSVADLVTYARQDSRIGPLTRPLTTTPTDAGTRARTTTTTTTAWRMVTNYAPRATSMDIQPLH